MGKPETYIERLLNGETLSIRATGNSMKGIIEPGQRCIIEPVDDPAALNAGDVVLCKLRKSVYLHRIVEIVDHRFLIGNNRGHVNGWTDAEKIYGKLVSVMD